MQAIFQEGGPVPQSIGVDSKTFDGVWFISFSLDHPPPHVHGSYGGVTVIVDLVPGGGTVRSSRTKSVFPANAKRGDLRRILRVKADLEGGRMDSRIRQALGEHRAGTTRSL